VHCLVLQSGEPPRQYKADEDLTPEELADRKARREARDKKKAEHMAERKAYEEREGPGDVITLTVDNFDKEVRGHRRSPSCCLLLRSFVPNV
jgi:hypothetical protein